MRFTRRLAAIIAACVAIATFTTAPASAKDVTNANEVATALEAVDARTGLVLDAVQPSTVEVSTDPTQRVRLTAPSGHKIAVGLPNSQQSGRGVMTRKGMMTYSGKGGSANAVVPAGNTAQFLIVVKSAQAGTVYTYTVDQGYFRIMPDGAATLTLHNGTPLAVFPKPWAKDAADRDVPTRFIANGNKLTQVIDHKQRGVVYPVVADPVPVWVILAIVRCGAVGSLAWVLSGGFDWWWRAMAVAGVCLRW